MHKDSWELVLEAYHEIRWNLEIPVYFIRKVLKITVLMGFS
jgi:hypothetical protein